MVDGKIDNREREREREKKKKKMLLEGQSGCEK